MRPRARGDASMRPRPTALALAAIAFAVSTSAAVELLNVSYDPTRELYRAINAAFLQKQGGNLDIKQSHGGSGTQARAVIDGLEADVVTLAMYPDTDAIRKAGLIEKGWAERLPNNSLPYVSTIVFVVRKGNPKGIEDWDDLVEPGVQVITPNPKTSGNGKLSFIGAWGFVKGNGGSDAEALAFVQKLYENVPVLDLAARASTVTFVQKNIGDVHLTWENEAHLEVEEAAGAVEIVYPSTSILAEPNVAWVDANVKRKGTEAIARQYLEFLYTPEAQEIIAQNFYRPTNPEIVAKYRAKFPEMKLFRITDVATSWEDSYDKFFGDGKLFDSFYKPKK
jgi:sulfate/thiosulfate-binding protein